MIEPLFYNGNKEMSATPINCSTELIATQLKNEQPMVAQLEPGDGTHYSLLIIPPNMATLAHQFGRYGVPPDATTKFLIVIKLDDSDMRGTWLPMTEPAETWHTQYLSDNVWSQRFLAWWLQHLQEAIDK